MTTNKSGFSGMVVVDGGARSDRFCPAGVSNCYTLPPEPFDYAAMKIGMGILFVLAVLSLISALLSCVCCLRWRRRGTMSSSKVDKRRRVGWHRGADKVVALRAPDLDSSFSSWPEGVARSGSPQNAAAQSQHFNDKRWWRFRTVALQPGDFFDIGPANVGPVYEASDQNHTLSADPFHVPLDPLSAHYVVPPEERTRLIECHLGRHVDADGEESAWEPHWASRLRTCSFTRRNDVDKRTKQVTTTMQGVIDSTVGTIVMSARPTSVITRSQVMEWYSKNNRFMVTADPDVRMCTALWIEWLTHKRAESLRGFGRPPRLE